MGKDFDAFIGFILLVIGAAVVLAIFDQATKQTKYLCPNCKATVSRGTSICPSCGNPLRWM